MTTLFNFDRSTEEAIAKLQSDLKIQLELVSKYQLMTKTGKFYFILIGKQEFSFRIENIKLKSSDSVKVLRWARDEKIII